MFGRSGMPGWILDQRSATTDRRTLDDSDVDGFFNSAEKRLRPRTREEVIEAIEKKNSYRMWRLRHDYKWLRKQLKKMGMNPDDARELL